jgi:hypothetical protein
MCTSSTAECDFASCPLGAGILFGLFFEPEDEGGISQPTTRRCIQKRECFVVLSFCFSLVNFKAHFI